MSGSIERRRSRADRVVVLVQWPGGKSFLSHEGQGTLFIAMLVIGGLMIGGVVSFVRQRSWVFALACAMVAFFCLVWAWRLAA